jgi:hypothetical protein
VYLPPGAAGTGNVKDLETILVVMSALAASGLAVVAFVGWWLHGSLQAHAETTEDTTGRLADKLDEQGQTLTSVSSDVHAARADVARLHATVQELRADLDLCLHGPRSLRAPVSGPSSRA